MQQNADVFNEDDEETDQNGEAKNSSNNKEGIVTIDSALAVVVRRVLWMM